MFALRPRGLLERVPLAERTTLGVGGPARFYLEATTDDDVRDALAWARAEGIAVIPLGGGSNVLVADRGVDALVLRVAVRGLDASPDGCDVLVRAGAGEPWDALVARAVSSGWAGIECLSGIPGEVGATPIQNVGAYGQEVADTIAAVHAIEIASGRAVELDRARCAFGYRDSVFKRDDAGRFVVTRVDFRLAARGAPTVRYAELARHLADRGAASSPSLAEVRAAVLELRRRKSMVLDPRDENARSAGSFFVNPTLDEAAFTSLAERAASLGVVRPGERVPAYPAGPGRVKTSAAWLIERAGFAKGAGEGRVGISTRHSLAIVNRGGATAAEIVAFAAAVRRAVLDRFGVALTPEPVFLGFSPEEARFP